MRLAIMACVAMCGAVGEALFPRALIHAAAGLPRGFCPSGTLAVTITIAQLATKIAFVFVCLWALRNVLHFRSVGAAAGALGSVVVAFAVSWLLGQPPASSWLLGHAGSVGAAWDAARWLKAIAAGAGAGLGVAIAQRRITTSDRP